MAGRGWWLVVWRRWQILEQDAESVAAGGLLGLTPRSLLDALLRQVIWVLVFGYFCKTTIMGIYGK